MELGILDALWLTPTFSLFCNNFSAIEPVSTLIVEAGWRGVSGDFAKIVFPVTASITITHFELICLLILGRRMVLFLESVPTLLLTAVILFALPREITAEIVFA